AKVDTEPKKGKGAKGGGGFGGVNLPPAWRGTLLPQSDADLWLAIAFADYERSVATEHANLKKGDMPEAAREKLDTSVAVYQKMYANAGKRLDVALADLKSSTTATDWYQVASSKGVLLLHALRTQIGGAAFDKAMDDFGMKHGGTHVTSEMFQAHMERASGQQLDGFFRTWLT